MKYFKILILLIFTLFWSSSTFSKTLPAGSLDPSFGVNGLANPQVGDHSVANAAVLQRDGKIVVGGSSLVNGKKHFTLARYNSDGTLDTTFGPDKNGVVILNASALKFGTVDGEDEIDAMLLQNDKIIMGGYVTNNLNVKVSTIGRFNSDGTLDTSFQGRGLNTLSIQTSSINALDFQSDGKILANITNIPNQITVTRFDQDGSLDESFGNRIQRGFFLSIFPQVELTSLKVQMGTSTKDKILIAGSYRGLGVIKFGVIFRLISSGNGFDSFGTDIHGSSFDIQRLGNTEIRAIFLQPDGKILLGAAAGLPSTKDFVMIRCNENCNDTPPEFISITDLGNQTYDNINDITLQSNGEIIAVGAWVTPVGVGPYYALVRYKNDGSLDPSFGEMGKIVGDLLYSRFNRVLIQPDGKILSIGNSNNQFLIARYLDKSTDFQEAPPPGSGGNGGGGGCSILSFGSLSPIFLVFWLIPVGYFILRRVRS